MKIGKWFFHASMSSDILMDDLVFLHASKWSWNYFWMQRQLPIMSPSSSFYFTVTAAVLSIRERCYKADNNVVTFKFSSFDQ